MDAETGTSQVVDPEVRAYIYSIVTALGGSANDEAGRYSLGDDALGCLRDLRKWLRFYDEKRNRLDVARCLGESNLVNGDLVPILALWGDQEQNDKHKSRIILACLELLVPLTWPVEPHLDMTLNHHKHTPYLQRAQISYKRGILSHASKSILRAIIRSGLPSITTPRAERSSRDEGIMKLILYLFRNLAIINATPNLSMEGDEDETSRSATIHAFHEQDVFALVLTMCSNIGEEFVFQDVIVLEILFHLVKGIDPEQLFLDEEQRKETRSDELKGIMDAEQSLNLDYSNTAPTRHGRFGTMIWVKREDSKKSVVSGQEVLKNDESAFRMMDKTKRWNKPRKAKQDFEDQTSNNFNMQVTVTQSALLRLKSFVEEFIDSGFNPLFTSIRKAMEREADRITESTHRHFFYVVSWLLQADRGRRAQQEKARQNTIGTLREIEPDGFGHIAGVFNQETFIALNRYMQSSWDNKEWQDLSAGMRCFTQILLTVQEMTASSLEDDQEIAENIQSRIFYEESTHDRILSIVRGYKDQGFWYLDACTHLAHVFLRMLERYSKQNVDMQIRSKKRSKRKKAKEREKSLGEDDGVGGDENEESEAEDREAAARTVAERSFDFKKFSAKFCTQNSVNTFVAFTSYYRDLNINQLKRAHRFFYKVAFKQELGVLLYRLDIIALFYKMIKGPEPLPRPNPVYKEWEELVRQLIKRLTRKLEQRPELIIELLFSKINATVHYLEYGYEKQTVTVDSRPAAELEIKPSATGTLSENLLVVVSALVSSGRDELVKWVLQLLGNAIDDRKSWELAAEAQANGSTDEPVDTAVNAPSIEITPKTDSHRTAMFKNGRLRLLFKLAGFELTGEDVPGAAWSIPGSLSSATLQETANLIRKHCDNPTEDIDGVDPDKLLRRKPAGDRATSYPEERGNVAFGSDSEGDDAAFDGQLFPPNPRSKSNALQKLKQRRRKKKGGEGDEEENVVDEDILQARRLAREQNARARQQKIKSNLYINVSDDESDEEADREFFAREEERRNAQARRVRAALGETQNTSKKRKQASILGSDDGDDDEGDDDDVLAAPSKRVRSESVGTSESDAEGEPGTRDSSLARPEVVARTPPPTSMEDTLMYDVDFSPVRPWNGTTKENNDLVGDDEDDEPIATRSRRPRIMAGFLVDSDTE
ncbi:Topoisomerase 1-associated factor 1 [Myotisia sp. PD_48]|nr:Topoisomerase 1-associated factor 1 [Myotisia sp. PD_48]